MASCHTHAALLGGALVSSAPTKHSCTNINYPTEFTEFTEASGRGYSPTDFTDAHRWLGCVGFSHRIHRIHGSFWQRIFSHRFHRCSQIWRVWHPAIPTQPLNYLPTEFTHTETMAEKKNLCTSVKSVGGSSPPEASVYSVKSVGEPYVA